MMDDVIYRKDAVKSMTNAIWHYPNEMYAQLNSYEMAEALAKDGLMFIPSAQQWIPCSERMPNYDEEVLVDYHGKVRLASLTKNDEEYPWYFIVNRFNAKLETVRAWMPLPDCYQGDGNNEM